MAVFVLSQEGCLKLFGGVKFPMAGTVQTNKPLNDSCPRSVITMFEEVVYVFILEVRVNPNAWFEPPIPLVIVSTVTEQRGEPFGLQSTE